jgi:galactose-3-O-sulfotransferase
MAHRDHLGPGHAADAAPVDVPVLIFIHIPKTAGSTLRRILERQYPPAAIHRVDGYRLQESWDRLSGTDGDRPAPWVVMGHMPFGIHVALRPRRCAYLTLVRHPVDRLASHYAYVARTPESHLYREVVDMGLTLRGYVEASRMAPLVNNGQTRLLGAGAFTTGLPATEETLQAAMENVDRWFEVAAPTDRFDDAVMLMRRRFRWGWPTYLRQKVTPSTPPAARIEPDTVEAILERNDLDLALYRFVSERFEARVGAEGDAFRREVARFTELNAR